MYRVVVIWENGSFVNSLGSDFQQDLNDLIVQYGLPEKIELRGLTWKKYRPINADQALEGNS